MKKILLQAVIIIALINNISADGFDLEGESTANENDCEIKIVTNYKALPERMTEEGIKRFDNLPSNHKIRAEVINFRIPGINRPIYLIRNIVTLNEQGQKDGYEEYRTQDYGKTSLRQVTLWKNGKKDGEEVFYDKGFQNKPFISKRINWENGKIKGPVKTWNFEGQVISMINYKNGVAEGEFISWNDSNHVIKKGVMKNGNIEGTVTEYWDNGNTKRMKNYVAGKLQGITKEFYMNGKLKKELPFKDGKLHGLETQYSLDGKIVQRRYWLNNKTATEKEFQQAKNE